MKKTLIVFWLKIFRFICPSDNLTLNYNSNVAIYPKYFIGVQFMLYCIFQGFRVAGGKTFFCPVM